MTNPLDTITETSYLVSVLITDRFAPGLMWAKIDEPEYGDVDFSPHKEFATKFTDLNDGMNVEQIAAELDSGNRPYEIHIHTVTTTTEHRETIKQAVKNNFIPKSFRDKAIAALRMRGIVRFIDSDPEAQLNGILERQKEKAKQRWIKKVNDRLKG